MGSLLPDPKYLYAARSETVILICITCFNNSEYTDKRRRSEVMSKVLPKKNELGFFEIRLESIGGLGANLAGKMLAEAGVVGSGFNGVSFSSYGSEKKGSPVKAHIRYCDMKTNIRDTTPVERPHIVAIFHENLSRTVNVISGIYQDSIVLVNSAKTPEQLKDKLKLMGGTIAVVDATGISLEEKNRVNMAMLGG